MEGKPIPAALLDHPPRSSLELTPQALAAWPQACAADVRWGLMATAILPLARFSSLVQTWSRNLTGTLVFLVTMS